MMKFRQPKKDASYDGVIATSDYFWLHLNGCNRKMIITNTQDVSKIVNPQLKN